MNNNSPRLKLIFKEPNELIFEGENGVNTFTENDGYIYITTTETEMIQKAVQLALDFGQIDGNHHKDWVIDQMLKILLGSEYTDTIEDWNSDVSKWDKWDKGIAP